eukprot:COSAG01_NODE_526_length_15908_cov_6.178063_2_plen_316_part_00
MPPSSGGWQRSRAMAMAVGRASQEEAVMRCRRGMLCQVLLLLAAVGATRAPLGKGGAVDRAVGAPAAAAHIARGNLSGTRWIRPHGIIRRSGAAGQATMVLPRRLAEGGDDGVLPDDCEIEAVGCFQDGENCAGGGGECRSLPYGVAGCSGPGTEPAPTVTSNTLVICINGWHTCACACARVGCPACGVSVWFLLAETAGYAQPSPTCVQTALTNKVCGLHCYDWFKEESDVVYAGMNNGECYCGVDYDPGGTSGQCQDACAEVDIAGHCDMACNGGDGGVEGAPTCGQAWYNMVRPRPHRLSCPPPARLQTMVR